MALTHHRCAARFARALRACIFVGSALALGIGFIQGEEPRDVAADEPETIERASEDSEELPPGDSSYDNEGLDGEAPVDSGFLDPTAADFDDWKPMIDEDGSQFSDAPQLRPFDWMRHWGFRHSSTDGRFVDKSVPLAHTSWLNRPYHVDWFAGPLLSDHLVNDRVTQSNEIFSGLRAGWDFDYYWGVEWRFGWADPEIVAEDITSDHLSGTYFVSDIDFVYYPWGDTRVRPFFQGGVGVTQVGSVRDDGSGLEATLLSMPFGVGVQFSQTRWLAWRLEIVDNLAFGSDGIDTMHNVAFTAGMEMRLGARPNSYWPWRSSRTIW